MHRAMLNYTCQLYMEDNCNVSWFQCFIFDKDKTPKLVDIILAKERGGGMGGAESKEKKN